MAKPNTPKPRPSRKPKRQALQLPPPPPVEDLAPESAALAGRPSTYSPETEALILSQMAEGKSIAKICAQDGMPAASTFYEWLANPAHVGFPERYARAAEERATHMAEESLEIADDATGDFSETENGTKFNSEHVQRSRLRVDTRKWYAARLAPKKYGDRVQTELSGPDGKPIALETSVRPPITREEWLKLHGITAA
jgi:hypothetical protein